MTDDVVELVAALGCVNGPSYIQVRNRLQAKWGVLHFAVMRRAALAWLSRGNSVKGYENCEVVLKRETEVGCVDNYRA